MKISSHEIQSNSYHQYEHRQSLRMQIGAKLQSRSALSGLRINGAPESIFSTMGDRTSISLGAKNKYMASSSFQMSKAVEISSANKNASSMEGEKQLVSRLVSHAAKGNAVFSEEAVLANVPTFSRQNPGLSLSPGGSLQVSAMTTHTLEEKEQTIVNTQGVIETQDGRKIKFGMHLAMERQFASERTSFQKIDTERLVDPLVIQFEDGPPSFSDKVFSFDLTGDGNEQTFQNIGKGSGFLAFDKNGDGKINDGTELFGTKSGNGFADLAKYDEDGNGWIDENDSIFEKLSIFRPGEKGKAEYQKGLLESNVGAIFLGQTTSQHSIVDEKGKTKGMVRSTGMFLKESGETGHVFQMDLAEINPKKQPKKNRVFTTLSNNHQKKEPEAKPLELVKNIISKLKTSMDTNYLLLDKKPNKSMFDMNEEMQKRMDELMAMFGFRSGFSQVA